jgi:hypothetical protein
MSYHRRPDLAGPAGGDPTVLVGQKAIMSYRNELHGTDSSGNPLPTAAEMLQHAETELNRAYEALGNAADWLRSDWRPVGSPLTDAQAARRRAMFTAIDTAKAAINQAKA